MNIRRAKIGVNYKATPPVYEVPPDWHDRIVILWEEDDAHPDGCETGSKAFERITGHVHLNTNAIASHDGGDWVAKLFPGGWVSGNICGAQDFVGIVAEVAPSNDPRRMPLEQALKMISELVTIQLDTVEAREQLNQGNRLQLKRVIPQHDVPWPMQAASGAEVLGLGLCFTIEVVAKRELPATSKLIVPDQNVGNLS